MYKFIMELGSINKFMKLKFQLVLVGDNEGFQNKLISKFTYPPNQFLKVNHHPTLIIEISDEINKHEGYDYNKKVSLNRFNLFRVTHKLKTYIEDFKKYDDLFYYDERNRLSVNSDVADKVEYSQNILNDKYIKFRPITIEDDTGIYEGTVFFINSVANYCRLTYDELQYLYYQLDHVDLDSLSLQAINLANSMNKLKAEEFINKPHVVTEQLDSDLIVEPPKKVEKKPTIPDI